MLPYVFTEEVWNLKAVTDTKKLKGEFERCKIVVVEITTVDFTGTIDLQGKVHELNAFSNVPYIRQDQATVQTPSVSQITPSTDTAVYRYVILGYWRRLQIVMTRSNGSITCGVAGSSHGQLFPRIIVNTA